MPWQQVLALGMALAEGLAAVHDRGVLHRDIKPANIILAASGAPKLVDFGLAKLAEDAAPAAGDAPAGAAPPRMPHFRDARALTRSGAVLGTPYYMAPEVWQGRATTPASEVYSLGVVLYELCTGQVPHHHVPVGDLPRVVTGQDAPPLARAVPHMDQRLAAVIERCLAREPAARFAAGKQLHTALAAITPFAMSCSGACMLHHQNATKRVRADVYQPGLMARCCLEASSAP